MVPSGVGGQRSMFGMVPVTTTTGIHHPQSHLMMPQVSVIKHEPMDSSPSIITRVTADLYLCDSGKANDTERPAVERNASVDLLDKEHKLLIQTRIKDSLSSFVPDIPGEFDGSNNSESMLRTLIDRPPIGGREFLPLSDQSLLGFRLHPGPLPDQYRLDPLTISEPTPKHHKKKKKHKHKHIDKTEESSITNYSPSVSREHTPPRDPCDFIKPENTPNFFPPVHAPLRPIIHHLSPQSQQQQPSPQSHIIQNNSSIIQNNSFLNMNIVSPMATQQSVIVQGNKNASYAQHMQAYQMQGQSPGSAAAILASGLKIPAKPKKKRHNIEGPEGAPKKKKKKDKDKDKNKEKKRRKHHNPDGMPPTSLSAIPSSSNLTTPLPSVPPSFTMHPSSQ